MQHIIASAVLVLLSPAAMAQSDDLSSVFNLVLRKVQRVALQDGLPLTLGGDSATTRSRLRFDLPAPVGKITEAQLEIKTRGIDDVNELSMTLNRRATLSIPPGLTASDGGSRVGRVDIPISRLRDGQNQLALLARAVADQKTPGLVIEQVTLLISTGPAPDQTWLGARTEKDDQDPTWRNGVLVFDGINDCVTLAGNDAYKLSTAGTLAAWVRPAPSQHDNQTTLLIKRSNYYLFGSKSGSVYFGYYYIDEADPKGYGYTSTSTGIKTPLDKWTHVACAIDNGQILFYENGKLKNTHALKGSIKSYDAPVRLGCEQADTRAFAGSIMQAAVYSWTADQEQINKQMQTTKPAGESHRLR